MKITRAEENSFYRLLMIKRQFHRDYPGMDFEVANITLSDGSEPTEEQKQALESAMRKLDGYWESLSKNEKLSLMRRVKQMEKKNDSTRR